MPRKHSVSSFKGKEVMTMMKKLLAIALVFTVLTVIGVSSAVYALETMKCKVDAVNKEEKKITLDGKEYAMSDEAAQVEVEVGDEVEATVENDMVTDLSK